MSREKEDVCSISHSLDETDHTILCTGRVLISTIGVIALSL